MDHYALILDSLIVVLLAATIVYAAILNHRLTRLRDNRIEMERATRSFAEAAAKADAGIKGLKRTADETGSALQKDIERAQALRDELAFIVEAAEAVAARLEGAASGGGRLAARTEPLAGTVGPEPLRAGPSRPAAADSSGERPRTQPDHDLLKAIENMR